MENKDSYLKIILKCKELIFKNINTMKRLMIDISWENVRKIITLILLILIIPVCMGIWFESSREDVRVRKDLIDLPMDMTHYERYELVEGTVITQHFIPDSEKFAGLELAIYKPNETVTGEIHIEILDPKENVILEKQIAVQECKSMDYTDVLWPWVEVNPNQEAYSFRITVPRMDTVEGMPFLVFLDKEENMLQSGSCIIHGATIENLNILMGYAYVDDQEIINWYGMRILRMIAAVTGILGLVCIVQYMHAVKWESIIFWWKNWRNLYQISIVLGIISLFCLIAVVAAIDRWQIQHLLVIFCIWILTVVIATCSFLGYRKQHRRRKISLTGIVSRNEILLITICILTRIPMMGNIQRWDGAIYYGYIYQVAKAFDFTLKSIIHSFRLAGHISYGYTLFALMGEYLFPGKEYGVLVIHMILLCATMVCIYRMMCNYWGDLDQNYALAGTLLLSFLPAFWGTFQQINIDVPLFFFFIFVLYAQYRQNTVLMMFWLVILATTKETGVFIAGGFVLGYAIHLWMAAPVKKFKNRMEYLFQNPLMIVSGLGIIFICGFLLRQKSLSVWGGNLFTTAENVRWCKQDVNAFYFPYIPYIIVKLKQVFLLNFNWIFTVIIIAAFICRCTVGKNRKSRKFIMNGGLEILSAFIVFLLFNITYLTHALSRYIAWSTGMLCICAIVMLYREIIPVLPLAKRKHDLGAMILGGLALPILIQNFIYIDPISNSVFESRNTGKQRILSVNGDFVRYDAFTNNYWYTSMDDLLDKLLREINYQSNQYLLAHHYRQEQTFVNGISEYSIGWNAETGSRKFLSQENTSREKLDPISVIQYSDVIQEPESAPEQVIAYFLPMYSIDAEEILNSLKKYYTTGDKHTVSNWGGTLDYYILQKK